MPVKKDSSGRRSVEAEVEVPGSPEEVWQAIATGPGISSWLVPTELDGRDGGSAVSHFGPGNSMDSVAKITLWDPPRRFVAETQEGPGTVATEWIVEARSGGACVVRVVHSWFASTDDLGRPVRGAHLRVDRFLPHPAALPHPFPRDAWCHLPAHGGVGAAHIRGLEDACRSARVGGGDRGRPGEFATWRTVVRRTG
jgi:uncharacterized protein YndB with AHSA1/START domain